MGLTRSAGKGRMTRMTNEPTNLDTHDHTLEGELRDYPAHFPSRASWDRYCAQQADRDDDFNRITEIDIDFLNINDKASI